MASAWGGYHAAAVHRIEIRQVDIVTLAVDAIVNAANEGMLGGSGVDGAIHEAAGPGLLAECRTVPESSPGVRCKTGEARLTGGHDLPAEHVIHTVGPVYRSGTRGEADLLAACYRQSLRLAQEHGLRSIAFPAISCGVYGYPIGMAAQVAVGTVAAFLAGAPEFGSVVFAAFSTDVEEALRGALAASVRTDDPAPTPAPTPADTPAPADPAAGDRPEAAAWRRDKD